MATVANMSTDSKYQERMTDTNDDDTLRSISSEIGENVNINSLSSSDKVTDNNIDSNNNSQNGKNSTPIDTARDAASSRSSTRQLASGLSNKDECKYVGDIYGQKKHGKGVLSWPDGRIYTGTFFADRRHGFGSLHNPNVSEFKGLYCHDERFGPGILTYDSLQCADVGLWLNDDLIRLLEVHPKLKIEICVTKKQPSSLSSIIIPSWYSPQELLSNVSNLDIVLKKKSPTYFCNSIQSEQATLLSRYFMEPSNRVQEVIKDKREQLDAYLSSIYENNDDQALKDKISNERPLEIVPPNETYEQRQLYYYINKFWPFKTRASFPIDDIFSNSRSSFPKPGPIENASLNLFELSFNGQDSDVRKLLMKRLAYVDVCDSRGFTSLHFATYNAHTKVADTLLDFGANVNQLSDDSLTPLALAFLLYYGNDLQEASNTALQHKEPVILNPRSVDTTETNGKISLKTNGAISSTNTDEFKCTESIEPTENNDSYKTNPYGYELSHSLRQRVRDKKFRDSMYSLIVLLLRRGADPSFSDWPLPPLALAVRAGDKQMVELLLKRKVQVNCQLDPSLYAGLTPLHIACGSTSPNAIDIVRLLLEHGANVNAESVLGNKEYLSLIDPLLINKITDVQQHGRTPLHIACTREATSDTLNLVRVLLEHQANPNIVCNGQTPLSLAIALGNQSLVDLLLDQESTDPSTVLGFGNGNALCTALSTFYESAWSNAKRIQLIERIIEKNSQVLCPVRFGPKNTFGSTVDYAHFMFSADTHISQTPYHALTTQERVIYTERKDLLTHMAKRFREEAAKHEHILQLSTSSFDANTKNVAAATTSSVSFNEQPSISRVHSFVSEKSPDESSKTFNVFRYCATCGRSTGVRLTVCRRCQKVSFCSKACKSNGWNAFHRYECVPIADALSPLGRTLTRARTMSAKDKEFISADGALYKDSSMSMKIPSKTNKNAGNRLPPLSEKAKLLRQQRLKMFGKSTGNGILPGPISTNNSQLSWNYMYNAPENYSFN